MASRALVILLFPLLAFSAEPDALAISANIQAKHFPFGIVLDQVNLLLPPSLRGAGIVDVQFIVDGVAANPVTASLK